MKEESLNHYIKVYDNAIPEGTSKKFLKICQNHQDFMDACIFNKNKKQAVIKEIRETLTWPLHNSEEEQSRTNVHWCNLWIHFFNIFIKRYCEDTEIQTGPLVLNDIQVLKYNKSGHYKFHVDHANTVPRTLSCIYLVNDDYEGGELVFALPNQQETYEVEKKANRMVIWPSNFLYPHMVKPVTKGIRYSIVSWAL